MFFLRGSPWRSLVSLEDFFLIFIHSLATHLLLLTDTFKGILYWIIESLSRLRWNSKERLLSELPYNQVFMLVPIKRDWLDWESLGWLGLGGLRKLGTLPRCVWQVGGIYQDSNKMFVPVACNDLQVTLLSNDLSFGVSRTWLWHFGLRYRDCRLGGRKQERYSARGKFWVGQITAGEWYICE